MTAKEKAKEIFNKYGKEYALIALNDLREERLYMLSNMVGINGGISVRREHEKYFDEIKQEIEQLP